MTRLVIATSFAILLSVGCSTRSSGTVSGDVTFNGQRIEKGLITFSPTGANGGTAGADIVAGKYQVQGLQPAEYQVSVSVVPELKIVMPGDPETKRKLTDEEIRARIDPLPTDTTGREQTIQVKAGKQMLDFKLESKTKSGPLSG